MLQRAAHYPLDVYNIEECRGHGICAGCGEHKVIHNTSKQLCASCYRKKRNESKQVEVVCPVCGKMRISHLVGRAICRSCYVKECQVRGICAGCGEHKIIYSTGKRLCKQCLDNDLAPGALRRYVEGFTSPFPYNTFLFNLLASSIEWNTVDTTRAGKYRAFGRFLQTHKFNEPLTWEAIEEALSPRKRVQSVKRVRSCLLDLGHLLAARGEMESREKYKTRCYALAAIQQAPEHIRPLLQRFAGWLWERRAVAESVRAYMYSLSSFWSWCDQRGISSPAEVNTASINDYLLTLFWQWQCSNCQGTVTFDSDRIAPGACDQCGAIGSYNQVKRYSQSTVLSHYAKLNVFFNWAKLNRMVIANPVQCKVKRPHPTIRHYNPDVIKNLCTYIIAPDAHPVEALILYLIIFHALSVRELRHAQLPNLHLLRRGIALPSLAEAYHIRVPKLEPSLGDHTPGRPNVQVSFPTEAAQWLKPLLERYERHRQQNVENPDNRYLLFSIFTRRYNIPNKRTLRLLGSAASFTARIGQGLQCQYTAENSGINVR